MKMFLQKKIYIILTTGLIGLSFLIQSCNLKEPTAPSWDVSLNLPITNKNYTLYDIIEKKSNFVSHYTEGTNKDLLYYTKVDNVEKLGFKDKVSIEPFSTSASQQINTITINNDAVNADVGFDWVNPPISPGTSMAVPVINNAPITVSFSGLDQFQYIKVESGFVDLSFKNYFPSPVAVTVNSFVVKDDVSGLTVIQNSNPITIQPGQTSSVQSFAITAGTTINNKISIQFVISTNGSGGQKITIPNKSITVNANLRDLKVSEANAVIPQQNTISIDKIATVDANSAQPNMFQKVVLSGGNLSATVTNNLNVGVNATFTIDNLLTSQGAVFTSTQTIPAKSTINIFQNTNLAGYSIVSPDNNPTNEVSFRVQANVIPSNNFITIKSTDNVFGSINFSNLKVSEFTGRLKPTVIDQKRSSIPLDLKDIQNKLQFAQVSLKNPKVELHLHPTANLSFSVNGRIEGRNSLGQKNIMTLSSRTMDNSIISPSDTIITLNADSVSKFFASFKQFPDSIIVYAGGIANPNYDIISVKNSDQVSGSSVMEIPFQFALTGGVYSDSVNVDLSQDDRDLIKDVNTLLANLTVTNGIASDVKFTGKLYDKYDNFLMYFPPKHQDQDTIITISGASTAQDGSVSSANVQTVSVTLEQGEPAILSNAAYMRVKMVFGTSGTQPVKFKTSDVIKIVASGSTNYHVTSK